MNVSLHRAARPPFQRSAAAQEELDLAGLFELFGQQEHARTPVRQSLRARGVRLRGWTQQISRRAAQWGAGAGVAQ